MDMYIQVRLTRLRVCESGSLCSKASVTWNRRQRCERPTALCGSTLQGFFGVGQMPCTEGRGCTLESNLKAGTTLENATTDSVDFCPLLSHCLSVCLSDCFASCLSVCMYPLVFLLVSVCPLLSIFPIILSSVYLPLSVYPLLSDCLSVFCPLLSVWLSVCTITACSLQGESHLQYTSQQEMRREPPQPIRCLCVCFAMLYNPGHR